MSDRKRSAPLEFPEDNSPPSVKEAKLDNKEDPSPSLSPPSLPVPASCLDQSLFTRNETMEDTTVEGNDQFFVANLDDHAIKHDDDAIKHDDDAIKHSENVPTELIIKKRATKNLMTLGLAGLKNIGNTCYMNTVLQCMRSVPLVRNFFLTNQCVEQCTSEHPSILSETMSLFRQLEETTEKFVTPHQFYNKLVSLKPVYGERRHQDAIEFLLDAINYLAEDTTLYNFKDTDGMSPMEIAWQSRLGGAESFFTTNFSHAMEVGRQCQGCKKRHVSFDINSVVMLSVQEADVELQQLLADHLKEENLHDNVCETCHTHHIEAKSVACSPPILVLGLKRYKFIRSETGVTAVKTTSKVTFPARNLVFGTRAYNLQGIAMHVGSINTGHYTAACFLHNQWMEFNDERVYPINIEDESVKTKSYALFYSSEE